MSREEKRYWVKVVAFAIIMNTLIVTVVVASGVYGTGGCRISTDNPSSAADKATDTPTSAPSSHNTTIQPAIGKSDIETFSPDQDLTPSMESFSIPSITPISTSPPLIPNDVFHSSDDDERLHSNEIAFKVLIPIALTVDATLALYYFYCYYKRCVKTKEKTYIDSSI
jgi:hypothetical protein